MRITRGTILRVSAALGIAAGVVLGAAVRNPIVAANVAPKLAWERTDGSVDVTKLPAALPVLDCDGDVVGTLANPFSATAKWTPKDDQGRSCVTVTTHTDDYETEVHQP